MLRSVLGALLPVGTSYKSLAVVHFGSIGGPALRDLSSSKVTTCLALASVVCRARPSPNAVRVCADLTPLGCSRRGPASATCPSLADRQDWRHEVHRGARSWSGRPRRAGYVAVR